MKHKKLFMKKTFILLLLSIAQISFAQFEGTDLTKKHEFGVNITSLINSVLDIGEDPGSPDFNFFYRNIGKSTSFRIAGLTRFSNNTNSVSGQDIVLKNSNLGIRFGVEGTKSVSKRFDLIYAWDFLIRNSKSTSKNDNSGFTNINKELSLGTGPAIRIQYNISENVSLMTEAVFYVNYAKNESSLDQFGQAEITSESKTFNTFSRIPTSIFLAMRF